MRIFLTGSNGFIGSRLVPELIAAGHHVVGLTRSDEGARALARAGAEAFRGDLEDLDGLGRGAARCDGVIHTAFDHDMTNFVVNCAKDGRAIAALGAALEGSRRLLVVTSGTAMGASTPGLPAVEDHFDADHPNPRVASERAAGAVAARGVDVAVVRLSQIHDTRKQGLVTFMIALAQRTGVSAYVGDGSNRWSATHVSDTARLYRLAFETHRAGARYHATAEEGIAYRRIAEAIGSRLGLPVVSVAAEDAPAHFGWLAAFADHDMSASSAMTREALGWEPAGPGLLDDLEHLDAAAAAA